MAVGLAGIGWDGVGWGGVRGVGCGGAKAEAKINDAQRRVPGLEMNNYCLCSSRCHTKLSAFNLMSGRFSRLVPP